MKAYRFNWVRIAAVALMAISWTVPVFAQEPLPSWNDTAPKKAIMAFVERVTKQGSPDFVPPAERIATFDNDGTLWAEQPIYFQLVFAFDRVKLLAPEHPEWATMEPFASLLKGDLKGALAGGEPAIFQIVTVTHSGMTTVEFEQIVRDTSSTVMVGVGCSVGTTVVVAVVCAAVSVGTGVAVSTSVGVGVELSVAVAVLLAVSVGVGVAVVSGVGVTGGVTVVVGVDIAMMVGVAVGLGDAASHDATRA